MAHSTVEASPQAYARIGGVLYLIIIVAGILGELLPRILGVLMPIAGLCYLTNSFALLLVPELAARLFPWVLLPCFVAETSFCLWLLVKGVNVPRWREAASAGS